MIISQAKKKKRKARYTYDQDVKFSN